MSHHPFRIVPHQARAPWSWMILLALPQFMMAYVEFISANAIAFTLRKFIEDPRLFAMIGSVNIIFNFLVGSVCSYLSDRVWTPWGRRKPFMVVSFIGLSVCLFLMPIMPTLWLLVVVIILYQFFVDVSQPYEPMVMEVVPPPQRSRWQMVRIWVGTLTGLLFFQALFANFDKSWAMPASLAWLGWPQLTGEQLTYWVGAVVIAALGVMLFFTLQEIRPPQAEAVPPKISPVTYVKETLLDRRWWPLFTVFFVLEADGVRWAADLGLQEYHSLESRGVDLWNMRDGSARWKVLRIGPFSHNTLTLDGQMHPVEGRVRLLPASGLEELGAPTEGYTVVADLDLTELFPGRVGRATRRVLRGPDRTIRIEDTVEQVAAGAELRWAMTTPASLRLEGLQAMLRHEQRTLRATLQVKGARGNVKFEEESLQPKPGSVDAPNPGMTQLVVRARAEGAEQPLRVVVELQPQR